MTVVNRAYGFTVRGDCISLPELRHFSTIRPDAAMLDAVVKIMGHDAHEKIIQTTSGSVPVNGNKHDITYIIAVHNTLLAAPFYREDGSFVRPSLGGCRIRGYADIGVVGRLLQNEDVSNGVTAIRDAKELSRGMSFKWGSLDLLLMRRSLTGDFVTEAELLAARMGGGKSVNYVEGLSDLMREDPKILERLCPIRKGRTPKELTPFERALYKQNTKDVLTLDGRYIFAPDMNTDTAVMEYVRLQLLEKGTHIPVACLSERVGGSGDPSIVTAEGVYYSMLGATQSIWKKDRLRNRTVSIEGVGKVGYRILERILEDAHHTKMIHIADFSGAALEKARLLFQKHGKVEGTHFVLHMITSPADAQDFYRLPMDIFSPNAGGQILTEDSIQTLYEGGCRVIVGGANNQRHPQQREVVDDFIVSRGIAYGPDYLVNLGGILNTIYERDDVKASLGGIFNRDRPIHVVRSLSSLVGEVLSRAMETRTAPQHVIDQLVIENLARHAVFQHYRPDDITERKYLSA